MPFPYITEGCKMFLQTMHLAFNFNNSIKMNTNERV